MNGDKQDSQVKRRESRLRGKHWRVRLLACLVGFALGLSVVSARNLLRGLWMKDDRITNNSITRGTRPITPTAGTTAAATSGGCAAAEAAEAAEASAEELRPERILEAIQSAEVSVRRAAFRRLSLQPAADANFYDFARDRDFPERAELARLQYVNLDDSAEPEALITFVRWQQPAAIVFQRTACGWRVAAILSSWLRFEDYPYREWLELPQLFAPDQHAILLRESAGDAAHYTRRVRLLRLAHGGLVEVAEFTEEETGPLEGYAGADWNDVKQRRVCRYVWQPEWGAHPAQLRLECGEEVVRYAGLAPLHSFRCEADGSPHQLRTHWRNRDASRIETRATRVELLTWNEHRERFVSE